MMQRRTILFRPGVTFIELLLFLGFFALCAGVLMTVLVFSQEARVRQQTIVAVEQEGAQLLQMLSRRIHNAESILGPAEGSSGSILALQLADEEFNPTIITVQSGSVLVVEHDSARSISPQGLAITSLYFENTSTGAGQQSVRMSFTASRQMALPIGSSYTRRFSLSAPLFPDDDWIGDDCGCSFPSCQQDVYRWQVCEEETCLDATTTLPCS